MAGAPWIRLEVAALKITGPRKPEPTRSMSAWTTNETTRDGHLHHAGTRFLHLSPPRFPAIPAHLRPTGPAAAGPVAAEAEPVVSAAGPSAVVIARFGGEHGRQKG
jgi:hypothetical protein